MVNYSYSELIVPNVITLVWQEGAIKVSDLYIVTEATLSVLRGVYGKQELAD